MKTINEWLNELPPSPREKAFLNVVAQSRISMLYEKRMDMYSAVYDAFVWSNTPEGIDYWYSAVIDVPGVVTTRAEYFRMLPTSIRWRAMYNLYDQLPRFRSLVPIFSIKDMMKAECHSMCEALAGAFMFHVTPEWGCGYWTAVSRGQLPPVKPKDRPPLLGALLSLLYL